MNFEQLLQSGIAPFVMREPPIENTSSMDTTLATFSAAPSGSVLVMDSGTHQLSGIITGSDMTKLRPQGAPQRAGDLATKEVIAIKEGAKVWQLLKIMNGENAFHRQLDSLPVVDASNRPVGVVKREQLVSKLAEMDRAALE
jgi:CBS domain-containing protein